jgi:hypothetical protein
MGQPILILTLSLDHLVRNNKVTKNKTNYLVYALKGHFFLNKTLKTVTYVKNALTKIMYENSTT